MLLCCCLMTHSQGRQQNAHHLGWSHVLWWMARYLNTVIVMPSQMHVRACVSVCLCLSTCLCLCLCVLCLCLCLGHRACRTCTHLHPHLHLLTHRAPLPHRTHPPNPQDAPNAPKTPGAPPTELFNFHRHCLQNSVWRAHVCSLVRLIYRGCLQLSADLLQSRS